MTLMSALADVVRLLEREQVPYMLIGGLAVVVWGEPRSTIDVDLTVDVSAADLVNFVESVKEIAVPIPDDPVRFADTNRVLPVRTSDGVRVDLIFATLSFEFEAIARARVIEIEGTPVRVCTPEDLIVHKIVSERPRDQEDVVGVLRRQEPGLDLRDLDRMIGTLADELAEPDIQDRYTTAKHSAGIA